MGGMWSDSGIIIIHSQTARPEQFTVNNGFIFLLYRAADSMLVKNAKKRL